MPSRHYKGKLRNRIFLTMVLVGVLPVVIASSVEYYIIAKAHNDDVSKVETSALGQTAGEIQQFVNGELLSQARIVVPGSVSGGATQTVATSAQEFALQEMLATVPYLESESYVNLNGQVTASASRAHANVTSSSTTTTSSAPIDVSNSPAFQTARGGNSYIGPVSYDANGPMVNFGSTVDDANRNLTAVVIGTADLYPFQNIVKDGVIGSTGYIYLVDAHGNLIAGSGPLAAQVSGTDLSSVGIVASVASGANGASAGTLSRYKNLFGTPVVATGLFIAPYQWGLVAEWPTAEADAVINALLLRNALILLAVLLAVILAAILLTSVIVRPVKQLTEGTSRVAQGIFNEGVYVTTGDELQELGESFNDMVQGLKQLEQLKDEFVFIAAHELRTPVGAMKGYLSLILDGTTGAIPDKTKEYIQKVIASDERLIQLVNDLLEVARSQAGRLTIKVAPIDIVPPVRGVLDELKSLADEKSVKLIYEPAADLPKVMGDSDRIKEVLVNLVGNAIKYMGGTGTVTISHERDGDKLVTRVADTGLGISKEAQEKLFQKFYRVQTDKTRDITGTGLGLFIVREIIEKMGGTIWVESAEGKGSTFGFSLPVVI